MRAGDKPGDPEVEEAYSLEGVFSQTVALEN